MRGPPRNRRQCIRNCSALRCRLLRNQAYMRLTKIIKLFEEGSVNVNGKRGSGKDLLTSNVIARRNLPYVSNVPYGGNYYPFEYSKIDCGGNTYRNLINGNVKSYAYPYPDKTDVYLSDCGVYFPSQYCGELNRDYPELSTFCALSRHLGDCSVHFNTQAPQRPWDKLREQAETYIRCRWAKVFNFFGLKLVLQKITLYDKFQSCVDKCEPCRIRVPLFGSKEVKMQARTHIDKFRDSRGKITSHLLFYLHRGDYDTRYFKTLLKGKKNDNTP